MGHMKHIKLGTSILILLVLLGLLEVNTNTFAQDDNDAEIYAVSTYGEKLDFKQLAGETAKTHNVQAYKDKLMLPNIPKRVMPVDNSAIPDSIIGSDDRFKVTDTTYFPWSTVVKIHGNFSTLTFDCSGWMLGQSTVVTAGHCIYDYGFTNTLATNVVVTPALNSDNPNSEPFGHCEANFAWYINLWKTTGDPKYDYGAYALNCRVGEQTGNLGYRVMTDAGINGARVNVVGYPLDKGGSTMWFGLGNVVGIATDFLFIDNDATGGQSGSPTWELIDDSCPVCVVAIYSGSDDNNPNQNVGVRVNNDVFDFLFVVQQWIDQPFYLPVVLNSGTTSQNSATIIDSYPAPIQSENQEEVPYPEP